MSSEKSIGQAKHGSPTMAFLAGFKDFFSQLSWFYAKHCPFSYFSKGIPIL